MSAGELSKAHGKGSLYVLRSGHGEWEIPAAAAGRAQFMPARL
jgi:hypothetical protein